MRAQPRRTDGSVKFVSISGQVRIFRNMNTAAVTGQLTGNLGAGQLRTPKWQCMEEDSNLIGWYIREPAAQNRHAGPGYNTV